MATKKRKRKKTTTKRRKKRATKKSTKRKTRKGGKRKTTKRRRKRVRPEFQTATYKAYAREKNALKRKYFGKRKRKSK